MKKPSSTTTIRTNLAAVHRYLLLLVWFHLCSTKIYQFPLKLLLNLSYYAQILPLVPAFGHFHSARSSSSGSLPPLLLLLLLPLLLLQFGLADTMKRESSSSFHKPSGSDQNRRKRQSHLRPDLQFWQILSVVKRARWHQVFFFFFFLFL